jgi:hypothetical protein
MRIVGAGLLIFADSGVPEIRDIFMTTLRADWDRYYDESVIETDATKDSVTPLKRLADRYRALSLDDRAQVDEILSDWVCASDSDRRFVARSVIRDLRISSTIPALLRRLRDAESDAGKFVAYERKRILELLDYLGALTS